MKVTVKFDASDSKQVIEAFSRLAGLVQGIKPDSILSFLEDVATGFLSDATTDASRDKLPNINEFGDARIMSLSELSKFSEVQLRDVWRMDDADIDKCRRALRQQNLVLAGEDVSHREDDIFKVQGYLLSRGRYIGAIVDDEVSAQTLAALKSAGIVSVKELSEYYLKQLMRIEGMDREGIMECRALLTRQNLTLRGDEA